MAPFAIAQNYLYQIQGKRFLRDVTPASRQGHVLTLTSTNRMMAPQGPGVPILMHRPRTSSCTSIKHQRVIVIAAYVITRMTVQMKLQRCINRPNAVQVRCPINDACCQNILVVPSMDHQHDASVGYPIPHTEG